MVGRFHGDDPHFVDFQSDWVPIAYRITIRFPPLSAEKIRLSLALLVSEILGPKVGPILHQDVYLRDFKHFAKVFSLIFDPIDPLFH